MEFLWYAGCEHTFLEYFQEPATLNTGQWIRTYVAHPTGQVIRFALLVIPFQETGSEGDISGTLIQTVVRCLISATPAALLLFGELR